MKKIKICLITSIFIMATSCCLTSCEKGNDITTDLSVSKDTEQKKDNFTNSNNSNSDNVDIGTTGSSASTSSSTSINSNQSNLPNISIETKTYKKIKYPNFQGIKNTDKINQMVVDYVKKMDNTYSNDTDVELNIEYEVMFKSEKYISLYFKGEAYNSSAAYPSTIKSTLNIDIEKIRIIKLEDIANINDIFENKVYKSIEEKAKVLGLEVNPYTLEQVKTKLKTADNNDEYFSDVQSYFSEKNIGVIFSVPHAIGDYFVISIDNSSIQNKII